MAKGKRVKHATSPVYAKPEHPEAQDENGVQPGRQKEDAITVAEQPVNWQIMAQSPSGTRARRFSTGHMALSFMMTWQRRQRTHSLALIRPSGSMAPTVHFVSHKPAFAAALRAALEPVEDLQFGRNGEARTERAEIAAVEALDEEAGEEKGEHKSDERPCPDHAQRDRGLERLGLGQNQGVVHRIEGEREDADEEGVLDDPKPLVQCLWNGDLPDAQPLGQRVGQFLQGAERAEPAAIDARAPRTAVPAPRRTTGGRSLARSGTSPSGSR